MAAVEAAATGFALMAGLIIAIGAQNAFVLRQGLKREHVGAVVAFCAVADAVLMTAGVLGAGGAIAGAPQWGRAMAMAGAVFLLAYGLHALRRAWRPGALVAGGPERGLSLRTALGQAAAFTLLNPHVYLDTVALVGSIANARPAGEQAPFALGASLASFAWFFVIGYGAKALRAPLSRPQVWRGIDFAIAAIMLWLAIKLLLGF